MSDMQHLDTFTQQYHRQVMDGLQIPSALQAYQAVSCLKDGPRSVFLLQDEAQRRYVLKTQQAGQPSSLFQEYDLLGSVDHPQIPKGICCINENGVEYLLREYVVGVSLAELVTAKSPVHERDCLSIVMSVCHVVATLHSQKPAVIHRDIKPQNIILSPDGVCHLIDFGAARKYTEGKEEDTIYVGTRITAPPEQFGFGQTDARSDVYSLGMLVRYLLTGNYEPLLRGDGSWGLRRIVGRCTAFDPRRRFATVRALYRAVWMLQRKRFLLAAGILSALMLAMGVVLPGLLEPHVEFSSPLLAKAIRLELGLSPNAPIPKNRLSEVVELVLCGREYYSNAHLHEEASMETHDTMEVIIPRGDISALDEIASLVNLRTLVLDYQSIEDIAPLRSLPLEQLSLVGNRISDIFPLAESNALIVLDLSQNPVEDCTALATMPSLTNVQLDETRVQSLEAFANSAVATLRVFGAPVVDYAPLLTMQHLHTLRVGYLDAKALEIITRIGPLQWLTIHGDVPLKDLTLFSKMHSLQGLDISYCPMESPEGLAQLFGLRYLNLTGTGIQDVSLLHFPPTLERLELRHNDITDFAPLLSSNRLRLLVLEETQRAQAQQQLADADFQLEIRPY